MKLAEEYGLYLGYLTALVDRDDEVSRHYFTSPLPDQIDGVLLCEDGYATCPFTLARTIWDM